MLLAAEVSPAAEVEVRMKNAQNEWTTRVVALEQNEQNVDVQVLTLSAESIPAGTVWVDVIHPYAKAKAGDEGFFVFCNGMYGTFRPQDDGQYRNTHVVMPNFGVKTPAGALSVILTGLRYESEQLVTLRKGQYEVFPRFVLNGETPYEDIRLEFHRLPQDATYADMAHVYRNFQLEKGVVKPLKERVKENPELDYAAKSMEIRVRLGWKPVPSPVGEQTAENEPEVHVAITFERFMQILDEFKRQGIDRAEFCLVGWNIGGHDGRYPQIFPVEPKMGGEEKLCEAIKKAQDMGFQIVCHTNYSDAYSVSHIGNRWDENFLRIGKDGKPVTYTTWGGGNMYETCPMEMYKRFADEDFARMKELGFRGVHYIDVFSTVNPRTCYSSEHPATKQDYANAAKLIFRDAQKNFGAAGSEGGFDYFIEHLDYALYLSFHNPLNATNRFVDRHVPYWQLVYSGIVLNNPYTATTNYTIKEPLCRLKLIEFGGRPMFYFYSKFRSTGSNWMGDADIVCATNEELRASVAKIKEGYDEFERLRRLQFEFMEAHDEIAPNVFRTLFSDGTSIVCNYGETPYEWEGRSVPSMGYVVAP